MRQPWQGCRDELLEHIVLLGGFGTLLFILSLAHVEALPRECKFNWDGIHVRGHTSTALVKQPKLDEELVPRADYHICGRAAIGKVDGEGKANIERLQLSGQVEL